MLKNRNIRLTATAASFFLMQFLILRLANQSGRGFLPEEQQELVYCFLQIFVLLGFFIHTLFITLCASQKAGRILRAASLSVCFVGAVMMLLMPSDSAAYLAFTGVTVFLIGFIGGAVYLKMSQMIESGARAGLCLGIGYASAIALQYCTQLRWTVTPLIAVLLAMAFAVLFIILIPAKLEGGAKEEDRSALLTIKELIFTAVITLAMLIFTGYYNSYIHHLQIVSGYTEYNVYSWPRLLMIPGIILFGVIGDIKKGRLLPIGALCMVVIALLNAVLSERETYLLSMCLYYLSITAAIAYYHLTFLRMAPHTKCPAMWASMGRVIDSVTVILSFVFGFSRLSSVWVLIIDIIALATIIIMMALNGNFNLSKEAPAASVKNDKIAAEDALLLIGEQYGLTGAELKVFRELVLTEDKQSVIAERLGIKVRTVQADVTSIYRKTGMSTRSGLVGLYHSALSED